MSLPPQNNFRRHIKERKECFWFCCTWAWMPLAFFDMDGIDANSIKQSCSIERVLPYWCGCSGYVTDTPRCYSAMKADGKQMSGKLAISSITRKVCLSMQRRWNVEKPGTGTLAGHGRTRMTRTHMLTGPTGQAKRPKGQKANKTFRDVLWRFYEIMRAGRIAMSIAPDPFVPPCVAEFQLRRPTRNSDEQWQPLDSNAMICNDSRWSFGNKLTSG